MVCVVEFEYGEIGQCLIVVGVVLLFLFYQVDDQFVQQWVDYQYQGVVFQVVGEFWVQVDVVYL